MSINWCFLVIVVLHPVIKSSIEKKTECYICNMGNFCLKSSRNNQFENILTIYNPLYCNSNEEQNREMNMLELYQMQDFDDETEKGSYSRIFLQNPEISQGSSNSNRFKRLKEIEQTKLLCMIYNKHYFIN